MKTSALLTGFCLFFLAVLPAVSQPTLTSSGTGPVAGDMLPNINSNYVNPGGTGPNQVWDFSTMGASGTTTYSGMAPSSTPYSSGFPASTVSLSDGAGNYLYYETTSSAWRNDGFYVSGLLMTYSDPEDLMHFPFTYNDTYTDNWACTFTSSTTYYRTGVTTVTADAYGTLTTPDGTFGNILRVHFIENYQDSSNVSNTPVITNYTMNKYMWYLNGNHYPIATVYTVTQDMTIIGQSGSYLDNVSVGVNHPAVQLTPFSLSPNPASEKIHFHIHLCTAKQVLLSIYNPLGQRVEIPFITSGIPGDNEQEISVADLPAGLYFASVSLDGERVATQRFIISR